MFTRLYVHIPFCIKKCDYCSFFSLPESDDALAHYCNLLCRELDLAAADADSVQLDSVYFGGGTPSLLKPHQLARLLGEIDRRFGVSAAAEITLEANPGTATLYALQEFHSCGVNRVSLGVQSFDDRMLRKLGRIHTVEQAREAVVMARAAGFDNLGIDLMHSLPGQTLHDWSLELRQALALSTEHLSVYGLTIEEGTPFFDRFGADSSGVPGDELSARMFEMADEHLTLHGFEHYEIANYARSGFRSQHNCGYWKRDGYLGLGAGAHSCIRMKDGDLRFSNSADLSEYRTLLGNGVLPRHEYSRLGHKDAMAEYMFLGLRLSEGISYQAFFDEFGISVHDVYGDKIKRLTGAGLLIAAEHAVRLTVRGMLLSNQVFGCFL